MYLRHTTQCFDVSAHCEKTITMKIRNVFITSNGGLCVCWDLAYGRVLLTIVTMLYARPAGLPHPVWLNISTHWQTFSQLLHLTLWFGIVMIYYNVHGSCISFLLVSGLFYLACLLGSSTKWWDYLLFVRRLNICQLCICNYMHIQIFLSMYPSASMLVVSISSLLCLWEHSYPTEWFHFLMHTCKISGS